MVKGKFTIEIEFGNESARDIEHLVKFLIYSLEGVIPTFCSEGKILSVKETSNG